jgi:hypothetical protein
MSPCRPSRAGRQILSRSGEATSRKAALDRRAGLRPGVLALLDHPRDQIRGRRSRRASSRPVCRPRPTCSRDTGPPRRLHWPIHRNSCGCYGEPSRINSNNWQPQPGVNLSGWHVYAARWTSTDVTWYLDGRRIMSAPVLDSTDQPTHLLFYNWRTPWQAIQRGRRGRDPVRCRELGFGKHQSGRAPPITRASRRDLATGKGRSELLACV